MTQNSEKHINSREVTIFRAPSFIQAAQSKDVQAFMSMSKESVGSYFESRYSTRIGSGLTFNEEKILMPHVIDTPADDRDFRKKVTEFFEAITTTVPFDLGITLEVGLLKDNKLPLDEASGNMPIKIIDYIRWRHAQKHPYVAASQKEAKGNQMIRFYIYDREEIQQQTSKNMKNQDVAMKLYLKIKENDGEVDTMLTLLGVDVREYLGQVDGEGLKVEALRRLVDTKTVDFIKEYNEGDIEIRGTIKQLVDTGIVKQIGQRFLLSEDKSELANTIDEMIALFKDEEKTTIVGMLQARRQEAMTKRIGKKKRVTVK